MFHKIGRWLPQRVSALANAFYIQGISNEIGKEIRIL